MKGSGRKRLSKKKIAVGATICIVAVGAGSGFWMLKSRSASAVQLTMTAQTAAAQKGNISNTVVGTGNLEEDTGDAQKVPDGLEYDEVLVEAGDEVNAGDSLAVINKTSLLNLIVETEEKLDSLEDDIEEAADEDSGSYEYQALVAEKEEDEAFLEELKILAESYVITAQQAGTVRSVSITSKDDASAENSTAAGNTTGDASSSGMTETAAGQTDGMTGEFLYLNSTTETVEAEAADVSVEDLESDGQRITSAEEADDETAKAAELITDCRDLSLQIPRTGDSMEKSIDMTRYAGTVNWSETEEHYTAAVSLTANAGYSFSSDIQPLINGGTVSECSVSGDGEGNLLTFTLTVEKQSAAGVGERQENENQNSSDDDSKNTSGTDSHTATENQGEEADSNDAGNVSGQGSDSISGGGVTAGSTAAGSTGSVSSEESGSGAGTVDANHTQAFSISSGDTMLLSVNVDELDILSVAVGQKAEITFDALEGESYTGTITEISDTASVSGGVAKYAVEIELTKDENMRAGMNASATITIDSKENIVTIPLNALQEQGGKTFVYTQKDEETGQLGGETEVETGLSDSENVEITSGLSEGDTVYYNKTGSSESEENIMMPEGGMTFDGGSMPDGGGERPSGNAGGGPGGGGPGM